MHEFVCRSKFVYKKVLFAFVYHIEPVVVTTRRLDIRMLPVAYTSVSWHNCITSKLC